MLAESAYGVPRRSYNNSRAAPTPLSPRPD